MNTYISYTRIFIVFIFVALSQNIGLSQCPPSAISTGNSTNVIVDTGEIPVLPGLLPPFIEIFNYCNNVMSNSAASIDITIGGTTTTFSDRSAGHNGTTNTCTITYNNVAADPTITNPFAVVFSDNPAEACTYAESGVLPVEISKFQIGLKDNKVLLEWETLEELNNDILKY